MIFAQAITLRHPVPRWAVLEEAVTYVLTVVFLDTDVFGWQYSEFPLSGQA